MGLDSAMGGGGKISSRIVISCAEVMKEYLKENSDKACKELKTFIKNKSLADGRKLEVEEVHQFR